MLVEELARQTLWISASNESWTDAESTWIYLPWAARKCRQDERSAKTKKTVKQVWFNSPPMLAISVRYVRLSSDSALQPFFQIWMFWSLSLCTWNDQPKSASCRETDQSWSAALLHFDHFESKDLERLPRNYHVSLCIGHSFRSIFHFVFNAIKSATYPNRHRMLRQNPVEIPTQGAPQIATAPAPLRPCIIVPRSCCHPVEVTGRYHISH